MGDVYLAEDTKLGRRVALKILPSEFAKDAERMRRFVLEAKSASALNHPNIITIYEIGEFGGTNFIATEYIEGRTLNNGPSMSVIAILEVATQIASALQAAHDARIIHRDIKPENVMIRPDGLVKVLDFGIAKPVGPSLTDADQQIDSEAETSVKSGTRTGTIIGTASYMSPEQARGRKIDARSDIFSFGVLLYEMLSGSKPFNGANPLDVIGSIVADDPLPLTQKVPHIPPELDQITNKALRKNPAERHQTASELLIDLKSLQKRLEFQAEFERSGDAEDWTKAPTAILQTDSQPPAINSIAVLAFANLSAEVDSEYFCDGLAEELLNVLSKIRGLRVAARTSAFSFKGKQTTISEIGKALNVASVLEGSVRKAGQRLRISVQLIQVADGYQLWSETYDRTIDDVFAMQDDIANSVVMELRKTLLCETADSMARNEVKAEVAFAAKGRGTNPEAHRLFLLGRYLIDRAIREDTAKAITYFREALDLDQDFALCWAELGRAYAIQAGRAWVPVDQGFDLSRDATGRALSLEPDLAEAHAQLGRIQAVHDWDFAGAEVSYRRALELAPGSSEALDGASVLAYKLGHFDDAVKLSRRVLLQDPLSGGFWHNLALQCHTASLFAESERAFLKALELSPQRLVTRALFSHLLFDQGRVDDAMAQADLEPDEFWKLWSLAILHSATGRKVDSDVALQKLIEEHAIGGAYQIAEIHSRRGEIEEAFEWLDRAMDERDTGVTHAKASLHFKNLYKDARWERFLKKLGLEG